MNPAAGFAARAVGVHMRGSQMVEDGLGEDAAAAIGGTEKQNIHRMLR
jgi:hypothetical protein